MDFTGCKNLREMKVTMIAHAQQCGQWCGEGGMPVPAMAALFRQWAGEVASHDKSPHTLKNWFSMLRTLFMEATQGLQGATEIRAAFLENFKLPEDQLDQVLGRATERRNDRAHGMKAMTEETARQIILGFDSWLALPYDTPVEEAMRDHVWAIAVSGRRPIEIRTTNFDRITDQDVDPDQYVMFSGQAKTRGNECEPYMIRILGGSETFPQSATFLSTMKAQSWGFPATDLRPFYDGLTASLGGYWPDSVHMTARALRGFYACVTYAMRPDTEEGRQKWHWINQVLGHDPEDMTTCQTYDVFDIARFTDE